MRSGHIRGLLVVGAAIVTITAVPALAQNGAAADASTGGDIIVTARRSEERLQDVPISISVLSQDAITKRNIYNAGDLGTYVPSLSTNTNFGPEKSSFAIRGFTQEGKTAPSVGVYFADVVAPRANGGTTSGNGAGVGSFMDLQNVQVLKGPQGTLFGRNTTGGRDPAGPGQADRSVRGIDRGIGRRLRHASPAGRAQRAPDQHLPRARRRRLEPARRLPAQPQRHRAGSPG